MIFTFYQHSNILLVYIFTDADQIMLQRKLLFSLKSHKDYPKVGYHHEDRYFIACCSSLV